MIVSLILSACGSDSKSTAVEVPSFDSLQKIDIKFQSDRVKILELENKEYSKELELELRRTEQEKQLAADLKELLATKTSLEDSMKEKWDELTKYIPNGQSLGADELLEKLKKKKIVLEEELGLLKSNSLQLSDITDKYQDIGKQYRVVFENKLYFEERLEKLKTQKIILEQQLIESKDVKDNLGILESIYEAMFSKFSDKIIEMEAELASVDRVTDATQTLLEKDQKNLNFLSNEFEELRKEMNSQLESSNELVDLKVERVKIEKQILKLDDYENYVSEHEQKLKDIEAQISELRSQQLSLKNQETELTSDVDALDLKNKKLEIVKSIQAGKRPSLKQLVDAVVLQNIVKSDSKKYGFQDLMVVLSDLAKVGDDSNDTHDFKVVFENEIQTKFHNGQAMFYNSDSVHLHDPILSNSIQCHSGTQLFTVLNSLRERSQKSMVFIYVSGHVLPGFIRSTGTELELVGIEMTSAGRAEVIYGPTEMIGGEIRVYDAYQVMLVELLKAYVANWDDLVTQMQDTMSLYGFKPTQFKPLNISQNDRYWESMNIDQVESLALNQSIFGFGKPTSSPIQERKKIDKMESISFRIEPQKDADQNSERPQYNQEAAVICAEKAMELLELAIDHDDCLMAAPKGKCKRVDELKSQLIEFKSGTLCFEAIELSNFRYKTDTTKIPWFRCEPFVPVLRRIDEIASTKIKGRKHWRYGDSLGFEVRNLQFDIESINCINDDGSTMNLREYSELESL